MKTSQLGRTVLGLTALLTALSACSTGSLTQDGVRIVDFAVVPTSPEMAPGDTVQFAVAPAEVGPVTWTIAEQNGGTIDPTGRYTAPDVEGGFTVIAASAVETRSASVRVTRDVTVPAIASFTASPATIAPGASSTLSWSVSGATSISIDDGTGAVPADSPRVVTPAATTTYTLKATNRAGSTTATVTVTVSAVVQPPTSPPPVTTGAGTTHQPAYLTGVTGGGAMPSTAGAPVASCAGDGTTDDTACLQNAINAAAAAGKPLLIPATASYYKISSHLNVTASLIGVNGMPTIKTTNTTPYTDGDVMAVAHGFSGWIYNLHLVGTYDGTTISPGSEWNHAIDLGCVNGVTIQGNFLERTRGDGVAAGYCSDTGSGPAQNVIVANNTMKDTWRCGISVTAAGTNWVIRDNLIDKQVNYVSGIDFEPYRVGDQVTRVEVLYNKFNMNNRTSLPSPSSGSASGKAVFGWASVPNPGGTFWVHHNYGTFGTGFGSFDGPWTNVTSLSNAEGSNPPN